MGQTSTASVWAQLPGFFREHPGLAVSGIYVVLSAVGMAYKFALFGHFGVNVFDLADVNDFLIAGLRHPETLGFSLLSWLILIAVLRFQKPQERTKRWVIDATYAAFVIGWFSVFVVLYAGFHAQEIRLGKGERIRVSSPGLQAEELGLIGTTGRYVIAYRNAERPETLVIPVEQVEMMSFDLPFAAKTPRQP